MKKLIIDRFEGNYAICEYEDKSMTQVPKYKLPLACKEGDCLILNEDNMYQKDEISTSSREKKILEKMNRLFQS